MRKGERMKNDRSESEKRGVNGMGLDDDDDGGGTRREWEKPSEEVVRMRIIFIFYTWPRHKAARGERNEERERVTLSSLFKKERGEPN